MPPKYSHVKKRPAAKPKKANKPSTLAPSPHADRPLSPAQADAAALEQTISRILLVRYDQDVARLFSTHLFTAALVHLPTLVLRLIAAGGPSWLSAAATSDGMKDFFRALVGVELRQAGERVATKSVLWSYTALRDFALANGVHVCRSRGLRSVDLRAHADALTAYADTLTRAPTPAFARPPTMGALTEGLLALEEACEVRMGAPRRARQRYAPTRRSCTHCGHAHGFSAPVPPASMNAKVATEGEEESWRAEVREGYERLAQCLWRVAREFDVRGYGSVLRTKLGARWCACGCSTDHLAEVCERSVQEEEEQRAKSVGKSAAASGCPARSITHGRAGKGKEREWDGRGAGVWGWGTEDEEDVWETELDFGPAAPEGEILGPEEKGMNVGELMEWRYYKAECAKEDGNAAFKRGEYERAIEHYQRAVEVEPEMPAYQLNIAAAHLKLSNWMAAEKACTAALAQHRSGKGYFRRAKARRMLGREDEAIKDLRAALRIQPSNNEALYELTSLIPPSPRTPSPDQDLGEGSSMSSPSLSGSSSSSRSYRMSPGASSSSSCISSSSSASSSSRSHKSNASTPKAEDACVGALVQITFDSRAVQCPPKALPGIKQEKRWFSVPDWERYSVRKV